MSKFNSVKNFLFTKSHVLGPYTFDESAPGGRQRLPEYTRSRKAQVHPRNLNTFDVSAPGERERLPEYTRSGKTQTESDGKHLYFYIVFISVILFFSRFCDSSFASEYSGSFSEMWSNEKVMDFINAVHLRKESWDVEDSTFRDRVAKKDGWQAVDEEFGIKGDEAS
ncbi:unnamed protein product [Nesidiocoris tenuis]|uniref:MADF domain-containing protein n=1 Tax=Nesidiocoris tenuis TaxID=355587 RepID=A0A6H5HLL6_9HEMI|nr:unnamed protein product [Nesidiocoris tenuis]